MSFPDQLRRCLSQIPFVEVQLSWVSHVSVTNEEQSGGADFNNLGLKGKPLKPDWTITNGGKEMGSFENSRYSWRRSSLTGRSGLTHSESCSLMDRVSHILMSVDAFSGLVRYCNGPG